MTDALIAGLSHTIDRFESGELNVVDLQGRAESTRDALDRTFPEVLRELEELVSDLEQIRFTMRENEQRSAALKRISATKIIVDSALGR